MVWNTEGTRLVTGDQVEDMSAAWPFNQFRQLKLVQLYVKC